MKIFQEMAEEWWFEKKYDMAHDRLGFPALGVTMFMQLTLKKGKVENISKTVLPNLHSFQPFTELEFLFL